MTTTISAAAVAAALGKVGTARDTYGLTLNTAVSPAATETIGRALAAALREYRPQAIAVWKTSDEAVLAHVVARELRAVVLSIGEYEGAAALEPVSAGTRVVLLATSWEEDPRRLATGRAIATKEKAEVVAVAAIFDTATLRTVADLPRVHLASERPATTTTGDGW